MAAAGLAPSEATALIVAVRLPAPLEAMRQRCIDDARFGVPAHVTLLYPFAEPAAVDAGVIREIASVVGRHPPLSLRLVGGRLWPDTVYVAVEPQPALLAIQGDLAALFPSLPLYGGSHTFEPHVSVAEGRCVEPAALDDPAWDALPITAPASYVDLIVRDGDRWARRRRFALGAT